MRAKSPPFNPLGLPAAMFLPPHPAMHYPYRLVMPPSYRPTFPAGLPPLPPLRIPHPFFTPGIPMVHPKSGLQSPPESSGSPVREDEGGDDSSSDEHQHIGDPDRRTSSIAALRLKAREYEMRLEMGSSTNLL